MLGDGFGRFMISGGVTVWGPPGRSLTTAYCFFSTVRMRNPRTPRATRRCFEGRFPCPCGQHFGRDTHAVSLGGVAVAAGSALPGESGSGASSRFFVKLAIACSSAPRQAAQLHDAPFRQIAPREQTVPVMNGQSYRNQAVGHLVSVARPRESRLRPRLAAPPLASQLAQPRLVGLQYGLTAVSRRPCRWLLRRLRQILNRHLDRPRNLPGRILCDV